LKRDELHSQLNIEYDPKLGYGIEKIDHPDYKNIWFVVPRPLPCTQDYLKTLPRKELTSLLSKARRVLNESQSFSEMDEIDRLVALLITRQEAVASSRIEGTYSTIDEVFSNPDTDEEQEYTPDTMSVIGYARSMEELIIKISKEKFAGITNQLFQNIHRAIIALESRYDGIPGEYRMPGRPGAIVQIGGLRRKEESTYNPAPPRHVQALMNRFIAWLSDPIIQEDDDAGMGIPLPLRMAIGHAHFESIHPFMDGNGRVGRMIWPMQMILAGHAPIHLSGFIEANKDGYYDGLKAFQKGLNPLPLLDYIGDALVGSHAEAQRTKEAIKNLPTDWKTRITARRNSAAERLLPHLIASPVMGVQEVMTLLKVTLPAAVAALKQLEKDGIVTEKSGRQRKQKYAAEEVLTVVGRSYGLSPVDALALWKEKLKK
jgi:Fic family protein